jgi:hypothetical protein
MTARDAVGVFALCCVLAWMPAAAFPRLQISSGTVTCAACHHAPAGGGLLNDFGRDQSTDASTFGGEGAFLHGAVKLPRWLQLGGDLRLAGLANDPGGTEGPRLSAFPMQADLAVRAAVKDFSLQGSLGIQGTARGSEATLLDRLVSREHFVTWQPGRAATYVRGGRFFAPFGLRLDDHTTFVRRYLGFNLLEETYGLSLSQVTDPWELHATAFVSDPLRPPARSEAGGAAMFELRLGEGAFGVSGRAGFGEMDRRLTGGGHGKYWLEPLRLMLLGELDVVHQQFTSLGFPARFQLASYAGGLWMPVTGLSLGLAYESFHEDSALGPTARRALSATASWLPFAHFEIMVLGRAQLVGASTTAWTALAQLHYYP